MASGRSSLPSVTFPWWGWAREQQTLEGWVRTVIGARPYAITYEVGGGSYVNFRTRQVVVDPKLVNSIGGERLLPCTWRGRRISTLARLQKVCSRAGARHEGGHVIITAPCEIDGELHGWLTNVLEDERMERMEGRLRRASRADFLAFARLEALHVLPLKGWTPASHTREDALLEACLYWRWCSKFGGSFARCPFPSGDAQRSWEEEIRPLVERAWAAESTRAVADIARDILRCIGLPATAPLTGHVLTPVDRVEAPEARAPYDRPLSPSDLPALDPEGDETRGEEEDWQNRPEGDEEPAQIDVDPSGGTLWARPYRNLALAVRPLARRTAERLAAPAPDIDERRARRGGRYSPRASRRTRGRRPNVVQREWGDSPMGLRIILLIDHTQSMNCYWPLPVIDPLTGDPDGRFHSPSSRMYHARRMAMALELACTGAQVPLCIGAAGRGLVAVHLPHALNREVPVPQRETVLWLRDWRTPPEAEGPKALVAGLYGKGSREQLVSALGDVLRKFREFPAAAGETVDLLLYVHDGKPDEESAPIRAALSRVRKAGILVYGVYVGPQEELGLIEALFDKEWTIAVPDPERLPARVSTIVTRLRRGRR